MRTDFTTELARLNALVADPYASTMERAESSQDAIAIANKLYEENQTLREENSKLHRLLVVAVSAVRIANNLL